MATASDISVGLVHELAITGCKVGWEPKDFTALAQSEEKMRQVLAIVRGNAAITPARLINCDASPYVPEGWSVEEHTRGGMVDPAKITLYLTEKQKNSSVNGNKLRKELKDQPVLNANVLDFYLANPHLIPEDWKGKYVFFWGTIYRGRGGYLFVRYLGWDGGRWGWDYDWLGHGWDADCPAAVSAS